MCPGLGLSPWGRSLPVTAGSGGVFTVRLALTRSAAVVVGGCKQTLCCERREIARRDPHGASVDTQRPARRQEIRRVWLNEKGHVLWLSTVVRCLTICRWPLN